MQGVVIQEASRPRWGLSGFALKVIALVLMTFDHIHYAMLTFTHAPILLTQLGRLSAPLFIFMTAEGLRHTRHRGRYTQRLYIASLLMELGNFAVNRWIPLPGNAIVVNNIFSTLFVVALTVSLIEAGIKGFKEGLVSQRLWFFLGVVYWIGSTALYLAPLMGVNLGVLRYLSIVFPSPLGVEGSLIWVLMGVGFYFVQKQPRRWALPLFYLIFCAVVFFLTTGMILTADNLLLINYQWLMVGSLPLLMAYNGQRGRGLKGFFYAYYPLHIYALTLWAHLMG